MKQSKSYLKNLTALRYLFFVQTEAHAGRKDNEISGKSFYATVFTFVRELKTVMG